MNVFEIFMLAYIPAGTYGINKVRPHCVITRTWKTYVYFLGLIIMGTWPLIYIKDYYQSHSVLEVVLVAVCMFLFALVGARNENT